MAEVFSCGLAEHRKKVQEENNKEIVYTDNLARYFAKISHSKPRPHIKK